MSLKISEFTIFFGFTNFLVFQKFWSCFFGIKQFFGCINFIRVKNFEAINFLVSEFFKFIKSLMVVIFFDQESLKMRFIPGKVKDKSNKTYKETTLDITENQNGKSVKFGIVLLLIYITYLSIGAAVFRALEIPNEVRYFQRKFPGEKFRGLKI